MTYRKGTPEYEAWKHTPAYQEYCQKIAQSRLGKPGRFTGRQHAEATKDKISKTLTSHEVSRATRDKISASKTGKPCPNGRKPRSEQGRENIRQANQRKWESAQGQELKARISAKLKGRPVPTIGNMRSPKHMAKLHALNKGKTAHNKGIPATPEQIARNREAQKKRWEEAPPEERLKFSLASKKRWEEATEEQRAAMIKNWINAAKDKKNTSIEQFVASNLDTQGIIYEREKRISRYYVDFFIPVENKIIEVNGCYWHACEQCGYGENEHAFRQEKDAKRYATLRAKGYTVEVLWEHDLRRDMKEDGFTWG